MSKKIDGFDGEVKETDGIVYGFSTYNKTCRVIKVKHLKRRGLFSSERYLEIPESVSLKGEDYKVVGCLTYFGESYTVQISDKRYKSGKRSENRHWSTANDPLEGIDCSNYTFAKFPSGWRMSYIELIGPETKQIDISHPDQICDFAFWEYEKTTGIESITIPSSVKKIGKSAFKGCEKLASVTIMEGVTEIGEDAFKKCEKIESITIPSSVKKIGKSAFEGCENLVSVKFMEGLTEIGDAAFKSCKKIESVTIPSTIEEIGKEVFYGCENISSLNLTDGLTYIKEGAFGKCIKLESVTIPSTVTSLRGFEGCENLKKVHILGSTLNGIDGFTNCSNLEEINIPDSVYYISYEAFCGCRQLKEINIPNGVTDIRAEAFKGCVQLKEIIIPKGVTSIGSGAFCCCKQLKEINIPNGVTIIKEDAFAGCEQLKSISIPSNVTEIEENAFGRCNGLTSITIPSTVTDIGKSAFSYCKNLKKVHILNPKVYIGEGAFAYCSNLEEINIPDSLYWIKDWTFYECTAMRDEITIPSSVKGIGSCAFYDSGIKVVNILNDKGEVEISDTSFPWRAKINYLGKKASTASEKKAPTPTKKTNTDHQTTATVPTAAKKEEAVTNHTKTETQTKATPPNKANPAPDAKTEPEAAPAAGGKGSIKVDINTSTTVAELAEQFKATVGGTLRIYQGNKRPAASDKMASIATKTGTLNCDSSMTVADFTKAMLDTFGLKVKVATCDDWVVALDALTLEQAGKVKKNATKADMEKML